MIIEGYDSIPNTKRTFDELANYLGQAMHGNSARFEHRNNCSQRNISSVTGRSYGRERGRGIYSDGSFHPYNNQGGHGRGRGRGRG